MTAAVAALAVLGATAPALARTPAAPGWKTAKVLTSTRAPWLAASAASGWKNIWSAGTDDADRALAWRWNGSVWKKVTLPAGVKHTDSVSTSGVHNTWILDTKAAKRLRLWDNGTWRTPYAVHGKGVEAIGAAGAHGLWAGGKGFIRHYTGTKWTQRAIPKTATITRIGVRNGSDIWAVGRRDVTAKVTQPYAIHWNGKTWKETAVPAYQAAGAPSMYTNLWGVAFLGANDVYAVGDFVYGTGNERPVLLHWNGEKWSKAATPAGLNDGFTDVAPDRRGGLWITYGDSGAPYNRSASGAWKTYAAPGTGHVYVASVTRIPGTKSVIGAGAVNASSGKSQSAVWLDR